MSRARITSVGSIAIRTARDDGVRVECPGWTFEWDPDERWGQVGLDAEKGHIGGRKIKIMLGDHILIPPDIPLEAVRIAVDENGENGYSIEELAAIASDESYKGTESRP